MQFKNERLTKILQLSDATFYDSINTIHQFIKPFWDKTCLFWGINLLNLSGIKHVYFEEYGASIFVMEAVAELSQIFRNFGWSLSWDFT